MKIRLSLRVGGVAPKPLVPELQLHMLIILIGVKKMLIGHTVIHMVTPPDIRMVILTFKMLNGLVSSSVMTGILPLLVKPQRALMELELHGSQHHSLFAPQNQSVIYQLVTLALSGIVQLNSMLKTRLLILDGTTITIFLIITIIIIPHIATVTVIIMVMVIIMVITLDIATEVMVILMEVTFINLLITITNQPTLTHQPTITTNQPIITVINQLIIMVMVMVVVPSLIPKVAAVTIAAVIIVAVLLLTQWRQDFTLIT